MKYILLVLNDETCWEIDKFVILLFTFYYIYTTQDFIVIIFHLSYYVLFFKHLQVIFLYNIQQQELLSQFFKYVYVRMQNRNHKYCKLFYRKHNKIPTCYNAIKSRPGKNCKFIGIEFFDAKKCFG